MMKLAVMGGGVRVPAFIRSVATQAVPAFDQITIFEPDPLRRDTMGRLAAELAEVLGHPGMVQITSDVEEAFTGANFVFSAIRVGGDMGRVIDEEVALRYGLVGQETTGAGGCAMALRTIPIMLSYAEVLARCSPDAVLINFTNPVGLITQAISLYSKVRVIGVCDTPGQTLADLAEFLGVRSEEVAFSYGGLNHLGWFSSLSVKGEEQIGHLLARFDELRHFSHRFAAFEPALVQRLGAIPTEYLYYFYDPKHYLDAVAQAGATRGQDVLRLNEELLAGVAKAFDGGSVHDAWYAYSALMAIRHETYMRTDVDGDSSQEQVREKRAPEDLTDTRPGGYEAVALKVIDGLTARDPGSVIVNVRNETALRFLDPDDVVEVPAYVHGGGVANLSVAELPRSTRGLISQVKDYEREVVDAAVNGDENLAALALARHPLVPGVTVARGLIHEYRELHRPHLDYLR